MGLENRAIGCVLLHDPLKWNSEGIQPLANICRHAVALPIITENHDEHKDES